MLKGDDLMKGDCEYGQLMCIFKMFGTPSLNEWPEMAELSNYSQQWPTFKQVDLLQLIFSESETNDKQKHLVNVILKSVCYQPSKRETAEGLLNKL